MKKYAIIAFLAAASFACGSTYTIDLKTKSLKYDEPLAVGENAIVVVNNIGSSDPTSLMLYLSDRNKNPIAVSTNLAAYGTNGTAAAGTMSLATTNALGAFEGKKPQAELSFDLTVWDSVQDIMLVSAPISVKNNPLAEQVVWGWTNIPEAVVSEMQLAIASIYIVSTNAEAVADSAYVAATNALHWVTQATTGNVDMVARNLAGTNAAAIAVLSTGKLDAVDANFLPLSGGTMLGNIGMGTTNSISDASTISSKGLIASESLIAKGVSLDGGSISNMAFIGASNIADRSEVTNIASIVASAGYLSKTGGTIYAMRFIGAQETGYTNTILATNLSGVIEIKAGDGTYPTPVGGDIILTPGSIGPTHSKVIVSRGRLESEEMKTDRIYFTDAGAPVFSSYLCSNGTNLFFISTVPPGFTNALTQPLGSGSGFPLTNSGDMAGFSLTNGASLQATNGLFSTVSATTLTATDASIGGGTVSGNWNILGNLSVIGYSSNVVWSYVEYRTNVSIGTTTTYVDTVVYSTNVQYLYTTFYTSTVNTITNWVDTFVNVGGTWNASNSAWVSLPNLYLSGTNATASGQWDFTGASVRGVVAEEADPVFTNWLTSYVPPVTEETDPIWTNFYATGFAAAVDERINTVGVSVTNLAIVGGTNVTVETNGTTFTISAAGGGGGGGGLSAATAYPLTQGATNAIGISTNTLFYLDLTAPTWIEIGADMTAAEVSAAFILEIRGTNSLAVTASGGSITGFPERVWLRTNRTVATYWQKPTGETTWTCDEL